MSHDPTLERCRRVYDTEPEAYDRLVSAEDCDGRLLPAILSAAGLEDAELLDVGTGTGRVARLLEPHVRSVTASDAAPAMLGVARRRLPSARLANADARALPWRTGTFDVVTAGWVFGHLTFWNTQKWPREIGRALDELRRVVRPGGAIVILETMGTGVTEPAPPDPALQRYYEWLEKERGFDRQVVRTDFGFESVEEAAESCGFFFGAEFADRIRDHGWTRVPEWTGIWSKRAD